MKYCENGVEKQKWKFFIVIPLWIIYLISLGPVFEFSKILYTIMILILGNNLFCWIAFLYHEAWHNYVRLNEKELKVLNYIYGILTLIDPQIYGVTHGSHHAKVNTYDDLEFYPMGEVKSKPLKIIYRTLEFTFGYLFLIVVGLFRFPFCKKTRDKVSLTNNVIFVCTVTAFYSFLIFGSTLIFGIDFSSTSLAYFLAIWLHMFFMHQGQMLEHGYLILPSDMPFKERNVKTRNVPPKGIAERVFLTMSHWESAEHVLHHTLVTKYLRPFKEHDYHMKDQVNITIKDYFTILKRGLSGEDLQS